MSQQAFVRSSRGTRQQNQPRDNDLNTAISQLASIPSLLRKKNRDWTKSTSKVHIPKPDQKRNPNPNTTMAQPLNPATATRADYNNSYINELPTLIGSGAHPMWKRMFDATIALFKALAEDDAMAVNNTQTFNTPAAQKNAQYFAWDFVMRTAVSLFFSVYRVFIGYGFVRMGGTPTLTLFTKLSIHNAN
jgi:hypothetical protein